MMLVRIDLPAFSAVAPGSSANLSIPVTAAYTALYVRIQSGATPAAMSQTDQKTHIERVKLKAGRKVLMDLTGANLIALNNFYGITAESGVLPIVFARPYLENANNVDSMALGTADLTSCTLEIKLSNSVVSPVLDAVGEVKGEGNHPMGSMIEIGETDYGSLGTAVELSDLPVTGPGVGLKALHFTTSNISNVEIQANRQELYQADTATAKTMQNMAAMKTGGRSWQSGMVHVDMAGNRLGRVVNTSPFRDFRAKLTFDSATAMTVIHETIMLARA
ncbi:major capsid protein P2 [Magnetococcus sp. PR-3]|uniref:major capsid protein P2 n=1 Tax=Magnetococcus sp. PR-3 TaxID=3120355 RepID=UPI002FCE30F5